MNCPRCQSGKVESGYSINGQPALVCRQCFEAFPVEGTAFEPIVNSLTASALRASHSEAPSDREMLDWVENHLPRFAATISGGAENPPTLRDAIADRIKATRTRTL